MESKPCKKCLVTKPLSDFYDGSGAMGKHTSCMECYKIQVKQKQAEKRAATEK